MQISNLSKRAGIGQNKKLAKRFSNVNAILVSLQNKDIPEEMIRYINKEVAAINNFSGSGKELSVYLRKAKYRMLKRLEKELKIVPKGYYRNVWLAIGMAGLGTPMGVAIGLSMDNMAFLGIGISIGLVIGLVIGAGMDKKAEQEDRQLDMEV